MGEELNIKKETINKLGEQRIVYLSDLWWGKDFKSKQELEKTTKIKINNFDYIKFKRSCTNKINVIKIRSDNKLGKILITKTSDKSLISQIYKELHQLFKISSHSSIDK